MKMYELSTVIKSGYIVIDLRENAFEINKWEKFIDQQCQKLH